MKVEMNLQGVDHVLTTLRSLPAEIVSKRGGPVKLALAKGARFLRDAEKANLRAVIRPEDESSTGLLEKNIIASRGKAPTGTKGERYLVRVKRGPYPKREGERTVTTLKTANLMEYGSVHQPPRSFIRRTVAEKGAQAITVVTTELSRRIDLVIKKLAKGSAR
jgi:HK97 gp10 family phage protein